MGARKGRGEAGKWSVVDFAVVVIVVVIVVVVVVVVAVVGGGGETGV